jgi:Family of unknown function (DUF6518)
MSASPFGERPLVLHRVSSWVVVGGATLGSVALLLDRVAPKWVGNAGAVWFMAGFVAGLAARSRREGMWFGTLGLVTATVVYYALRLATSASFSVVDLVPIPAGWLAIGIATGAVAGWLGARARSERGLWGAPAGAFLGEAAAVMVLRQRVTQAVVEILCASICLWAARSALRRGLVVAASAVPFVALFATWYRLVMWW